jgi:hypothetical protein
MSDPRTGKASGEGLIEESRNSFKDVVKGNPKRRGEDVEMGGVCKGQIETCKKETNLSN